MANQLYGYNSSYASAGGGGGGTPTPSSSLRYLVGSSDSDHSKYTPSSIYSDVLRYSSQHSWPSGVEPTDHLSTPIKRASEALYHQTLLGAHTTLGQSEAWYSTNSLAKRPRFENTSHLPVYPQRPGEKDCAHYMQTRTCKYGPTCKFDHPIWVPEGGIPDWKEVPLIATSDSLPERPGEPDCPYFLKTQRCKFGLKCKFNHPKENLITSVGSSGNADVFTLPDRPSEPPCAFYLKTGTCKFGVTCKFHHPKDMQMPSAAQENGDSKQNESVTNGTAGDLYVPGPLVSYAPARLHNTKGLPIRPGEVDCPFYLKTGSCKYGATCRYNHPDRNAINPAAAAAIGHPLITSPGASLNIGVVNPAASIYQTIDPRLAQPTLEVGTSIYPQRPGQMECDYYMKTGECKYGERCKFHHPIDRSAPTLSAAKQASQENIKLTLAGLPRREGAVHCPYYMKTGTCKYGATCKFDHPPPGEVMAMAASQGTSSGEVRGDENEAETSQAERSPSQQLALMSSISSLKRRRNFFKNARDPSLSNKFKRCSAATQSSLLEPDQDDDKNRKTPEIKTLFRRLWKVAAPYWYSDDKVQARLQLASVFALTLATTGISVGFNFLGRDFYNALANKDQEQFTKQLLYYLGGFAGGIPFFVLRDYARETLALRWRSWMTKYYIDRYLTDQTFYRIQSQSIIDNPDQRIVDDLSSFTGTSLSFSLTLFNAAVDLISFSNILYGIYPPLFVVLLVYSIGGTAISVFLGKGLVNLNFLQEKKEADFRYGLVRVRENAESIAFYGGEENEMQLLLQRFKSAFENLTQLLISSRNLEFFTNGYRYLIQILPAAVVAPMYFSGKIEFGVINQSVSAFNHILGDFSLIVFQFQSISAFSAVIDRLGTKLLSLVCLFNEAFAFSDKTKFYKDNESFVKCGKQELTAILFNPCAVHCPYYMKTGTCKYGATCKFDHPPPGEVMAMAASQGTSSGEVRGDENEAETSQAER
ncbi:uncharacterized protein LOC116142056 [Pistacia vera]|uniref:uncharacterized protein LOC116142056 n=1 Tax=Pistacia vera TaxID=55513 RepID=UPI0012633A81|nr:uncharacterized protein LOC116142056 [Pistacia vera]